MSISSATLPTPPHGFGRFTTAITDTAAVTRRNLVTLRRVPQLLIFSSIQPIIFVLMFRYVFGGAIEAPGGYANFLMPGIFAQTVTFGAINTAVGLSTDLKSGMLERFQSLPMARSAVLAGRTLGDLCRNVLVVFLMMVVGFWVGFHYQTNALMFASAVVLILCFGYALSWVFATVGLLVGDPEAAQAAAFPVMAPLVFASTAFVPLEKISPAIQPFTRNQPVTQVIEALRALCLGGPTKVAVLKAVAWIIGLLVVFVPIAVRKYRRAI